jgi:protein-disulfide isomerase
MSRYLPFTIVILVGLLAIAGGITLYQIKRPHILTASSEKMSKTAPGETLHIRGNPDAAVTLEEFGDYQCPPCGLLAEPINKLEQDFRPHLRVIFYNYPLPTHQHAREAACAAEAAGLQGKFWEMHDLIYREQANWSKAADVQPLFSSYAGMLGLDLERFKKDMQSDAVKSRVDTDQKKGASIGVQNTPTLFLNNHAIPPADLPPDRVRTAVAAAVKAAGATPAESHQAKK